MADLDQRAGQQAGGRDGPAGQWSGERAGEALALAEEADRACGAPATARADRPQHLRLRACADLLVALGVTSLPLFVLAEPYEALLVALVIGSVAIVWFVARRERDMARRSESTSWRAEALEGRGVSLAAWHAGASPPRHCDQPR